MKFVWEIGWSDGVTQVRWDPTLHPSSKCRSRTLCGGPGAQLAPSSPSPTRESPGLRPLPLNMTRSFQELQEVFQREPSMRLPGAPSSPPLLPHTNTSRSLRHARRLSVHEPHLSARVRAVPRQRDDNRRGREGALPPAGYVGSAHLRASLTFADELPPNVNAYQYTSALTALFLMRMPRRLGFRNHRWFMPAIDGLAVLLFVQPAVALETRLLLDDRRRVLDAVRLMQEESRRRWSMDPPEKGKVPVLPPPGREAQQPPVLPPPGREEPWWGAENEGGPEREPDDAWAGGGQSEKRKNELSEFDWRPR
ncbi:hypothetical protein CALVIDRAFT_542974 [Calocera viscosa TUFC12733]|uniref:Uncharacterized protein n=1 Tax=Calocera viscosa (strain TUFC12733) TaxID=1330018 RepID=A0A167G3M6_CALVF|nr:hypothetical protein CALVIDRAFT_542974 [Calocera viscosa TUFC12733]